MLFDSRMVSCWSAVMTPTNLPGGLLRMRRVCNSKSIRLFLNLFVLSILSVFFVFVFFVEVLKPNSTTTLEPLISPALTLSSTFYCNFQLVLQRFKISTAHSPIYQSH